MLASDVIKNNENLVVGYIKSGQDGVDGNIVIKAYIDKNKIVISDTYPEEVVRTVNENFDGTACSVALTGVANASTYCASSSALQEAIDNEDLEDAQISALVSSGMVTEYTNGTPASFGEGRTVLTTTEWNGLQTNGVSFQVKVEANEGVWVEEPANGTIESCPDCKFIYTTDTMYTTWNNKSETPTEITSGYSENYNDIVTSSGKNYFLGVKLNNNNEVTNAYACGVKDGTPFCIEGTSDGSKYTANQTLLQGANLYNNSCTVESDLTECGPWDNSGSLSARAISYGHVGAGIGYDDDCFVAPFGRFACIES